MVNSTPSSTRKAVDEAFRRMFDYEWGTKFDVDAARANARDKEMVRIFGTSRAARILRIRGARRAARGGAPPSAAPSASSQLVVDYKAIVLPSTVNSAAAGGAGAPPGVDRSAATGAPQIKPPSKIDNVLELLAGPAKKSTVAKTSDDWESFKESDKQLQDDLEKHAQGKDAYLVKKDFLLRVDNRKFEIEKEGRDRERASRMNQG